jgi:hypothetical protein
MRSAAPGWPTLRELAAEGALPAHSKTYGGRSRNRRDAAWVAVPRIFNVPDYVGKPETGVEPTRRTTTIGTGVTNQRVYSDMGFLACGRVMIAFGWWLVKVGKQETA